MLLRKTESKFGAPADVYVGKFKGVSQMKDEGKPRLGKDGNPMEPGIEWQWEITEGEFRGQLVGRITGSTPTTKNACGTLLDGVLDRKANIGEDTDPNSMIGKLYRVVVSPSKDNPERTNVTQVKLMSAGTAPAPASRPARPTPAPKPSAANGYAASTFYVAHEAVAEDAVLDRQGVQAAINQHNISADELQLCPFGEQTWRSAKSFGFEDGIPI
jgi:hypothetical protein